MDSTQANGSRSAAHRKHDTRFESGTPMCVFTLHQPYSTWARLIAWCDLLLGVRVSPRLYAKAPPRTVGECA